MIAEEGRNGGSVLFWGSTAGPFFEGRVTPLYFIICSRVKKVSKE
jgi:hypothetical protein